MFKVLALSALFFVFSAEAANLACKSDTNEAVSGTCPVGTTLLGESCCSKEDVYDVDAYACRSEPIGPAIGVTCPPGFIPVTTDFLCCDTTDAYVKHK